MRTKLKSFILTALLFGLVSLPAQAQWIQRNANAPKKSTAFKVSGKWSLIPALDSDTADGQYPGNQFDVERRANFPEIPAATDVGTLFMADSIPLYISVKK